jgi:enoyl-CoA hydratase
VNVRVDTPSPQVRLLTLDRPERLNAMSFALVDDLHTRIDEVEKDRDCRVVVVTGAGRGFCSGFDLVDPGVDHATEGLGPVEASLRSMDSFYAVVERLHAVRKPVIAAVNGPAVGGGLAIALGADIRIAAQSASFGVAFVRVGYSACDLGTSYLLPRLIGAGPAAELMLTGRVFDAHEAKEIGLVVRVAPDAELLSSALATAALIIDNTPLGVAMTKEVLWSNLDAPSLAAAILVEKRTNFITGRTEDFEEAHNAFAERRQPRFRGR